MPSYSSPASLRSIAMCRSAWSGCRQPAAVHQPSEPGGEWGLKCHGDLLPPQPAGEDGLTRVTDRRQIACPVRYVYITVCCNGRLYSICYCVDVLPTHARSAAPELCRLGIRLIRV